MTRRFYKYYVRKTQMVTSDDRNRSRQLAADFVDDSQTIQSFVYYPILVRHTAYENADLRAICKVYTQNEVQDVRSIVDIPGKAPSVVNSISCNQLLVTLERRATEREREEENKEIVRKRLVLWFSKFAGSDDDIVARVGNLRSLTFRDHSDTIEKTFAILSVNFKAKARSVGVSSIEEIEAAGRGRAAPTAGNPPPRTGAGGSRGRGNRPQQDPTRILPDPDRNQQGRGQGPQDSGGSSQGQAPPGAGGQGSQSSGQPPIANLVSYPSPQGGQSDSQGQAGPSGEQPRSGRQGDGPFSMINELRDRFARGIGDVLFNSLLPPPRRDGQQGNDVGIQGLRGDLSGLTVGEIANRLNELNQRAQQRQQDLPPNFRQQVDEFQRAIFEELPGEGQGRGPGLGAQSSQQAESVTRSQEQSIELSAPVFSEFPLQGRQDASLPDNPDEFVDAIDQSNAS